MPNDTLMDRLAALQARAAAEAPARTALVDALIAELRASALMGQTKKSGDRAPAFALPDASGQMVRLADMLARGPIILCFYRGGWCPYCNVQLRAYQALLPTIEALGAALVAISPQSPDRSRGTVEKNQLAFRVLSDHGNAVAAAFGLVFTVPPALQQAYDAMGIRLPAINDSDDWNLPVPATYVIAPNGTIALAHIDPDYRTRLEPGAALDALRTLRR